MGKEKHSQEKNHMEKIVEEAKYKLKDEVKQIKTNNYNINDIKLGIQYLEAGNVSKAETGNNKHKEGSKWVEVTLKKDMGNVEAILTYKEDGIAGTPDEIKYYEPLELSSDEIVRYIKNKL